MRGAAQAPATLNKRWVTLHKRRGCNAEQALGDAAQASGLLNKRVCNAEQAFWNAAQACLQR